MKVLFLLLVFVIQNAFGQEAQEKFYKVKYIVERNDTLASSFKRFVKPDSVITRNSSSAQRTFKENPSVTNWKKLKPGQRIDLYIRTDLMDLKKYEDYLEHLKLSLRKKYETENSISSVLPQGFKGSIFYLASYGKFSQKDPKTAEVEFFQNSPVSTGVSLSYYPKDSNWSFASSAYMSYLLASGNNLDDSNVSVAPELGATFYPEYRFVNHNFTGYFGVDYERFSTFNMGGIQQNRKILLDQNTVLYATLGVAKLVPVFKSPFFTKFSISKSLTSSIDSNPDGIESSGGYNGYKILWYVNKKFTDRLYFHSLFKYHWMDGPSELTTLRLGLGIGYILF